MYCHECGEKKLSKDLFCKNCGVSFHKEAPKTAPEEESYSDKSEIQVVYSKYMKEQTVKWLKVGAVIVVIVAYYFWPQINDYYTVATYNKSSAEYILAKKVSFTNKGISTYLATSPKILNKAKFRQTCSLAGSDLAGCYLPADKAIYILNVIPTNVKDAMTVTAAHEMLHHAYLKLSNDERKKLDSELSSIINLPANSLLKEYASSSDAGYQRNSEFYAYIGTEGYDLGTYLTQHYAEYFVDRSIIVRANERVNTIISNAENTIERMEASLIASAAVITSNRVIIARQENTLRYSYFDSSWSYNNYYNTYINNYNRTNSLITSYNKALSEYNDYYNDYEELIGSLSSGKFSPYDSPKLYK